MKNVLITTWISSDNYGSLLQAYCLKYIIENIKIFSNKGISDDIKVYLFNHCENQEIRFKKKQRISSRKALNRINNKIWRLCFNRNFVKRMKKFEVFKAEKLNLYPKRRLLVNSIDDLKKMKEFDLYIAGSDQIWNPKLLNPIYLLNWVPNNKPRISYAASVCVNELNKNELEKYKPLAKFESISVREYTAAVDQISKLVHKKITEVVDPVILYGRKAMLKHCKEDKTKKYILVYMLHDSVEARNYYSKLAVSNGLEIKIIPFTRVNSLLPEMILSKKFEWNVNPLDFVNLIYNSDILVTDSYHGVITALLLHKNFILIPRDSGPSQQNNRIINLLEKIGLANRINKKLEKIDEIELIDWNEVDKKLENMRTQSMNYLIDTLNLALENDK